MESNGSRMMKTQIFMMPGVMDKGKMVMQTDLALNNHHIREVSRQTAKITKRLLLALNILKTEVSEKQESLSRLACIFHWFLVARHLQPHQNRQQLSCECLSQKGHSACPKWRQVSISQIWNQVKEVCTSARLYPKVTLLHALPTCNLFLSVFLVTKCLVISIKLRLYQGVPFSQLLLLLCRSKIVLILYT